MWVFAETVLLVATMLRVCEIAGQTCLDELRFFPGKEIGRMRANRMNGISGMAASRKNSGVLWVHNGEKINRMFAISSDGRPLGTFTFSQDLLDAEDVSFGPGPRAGLDYLYLGDIGDAVSQRQQIVIARFLEPDVVLNPDGQTTAPFGDQSFFVLQYPDGPKSAETLLIDPLLGHLLVITREPSRAQVYSATLDEVSNGGATLRWMADLAVSAVTAGDISTDGRTILLRNPTSAFLYSRQKGESVSAALLRQPKSLSLAQEPQGESIAFTLAGDFLTTSEGEDQPIYLYQRNTTAFEGPVELGVADDPALAEISGIAVSRRHPSLLWVHNDGPSRTIFALHTTGNVLARFELSADLVDFEDIALGPGPEAHLDYLYAGDIGDNETNRSNIRIVRVPEPLLIPSNAPPSTVSSFASEEILTLEFPDGPHNAEALLVDPLTGDLFICSKEQSVFRLYKATRDQLRPISIIPLELVQTGSFASVSGGDISPDGTALALRREDAARLWRRNTGESIEAAITREGEVIPVVGPPLEANGEAISFGAARAYFTMSEGAQPSVFRFVPVPLVRFEGVPVMTPGGIRIGISACADLQIKFEHSTNLSQWNTLTNLSVRPGKTNLTFSANGGHQFYRFVYE